MLLHIRIERNHRNRCGLLSIRGSRICRANSALTEPGISGSSAHFELAGFRRPRIEDSNICKLIQFHSFGASRGQTGVDRKNRVRHTKLLKGLALTNGMILFRTLCRSPRYDCDPPSSGKAA